MLASLTQFKEGIFKGNPVFVKALVLCPVVAITTNVENAIGMGLATLLVLLPSCFIASLFRNLIPGEVRIPCFLVLSATFTTVVSILMELFFPGLHNALGIFVLLIGINSLVLARMGDFAANHSPLTTVFDALGMGLGFTLALSLLGLVRELISFGTIFGFAILPDAYPGFILMALPAGGFLAFGFIMAGITALARKTGQRKEA
jgi:electron transport complex protein RnfE